MLPVSEVFLAALRSSHEAVFRAILCDAPGQTGVEPTGTELPLTDIGGSVTLDAEATVRGRCEIEVASEWPETLDAESLTPYGAEVFVSRGISLGNGKIERAPLGYYRLTAVDQDDAPSGALRLTGLDRMQGVIEARFEAPLIFGEASTYGSVIEMIVSEVYPWVVIEWDDLAGDDPIGRTVVGEEDRYALLLDLVTSLGKVAYFDYRGVLRIETPPDPTVPVWEVSAGRNGVLVSLARSLSREGVYNAVVAVGEALDDTPPVRGVAYDLDPESPTYWNGEFGKVPRFYSSPLLTTTGQATAAAESLLAQSTGLPYLVDFTSVPNPAIEPLDVVRVTYPRVGREPAATEVHVISQVRIPLSSTEAMPSVTRKQTL